MQPTAIRILFFYRQIIRELLFVFFSEFPNLYKIYQKHPDLYIFFLWKDKDSLQLLNPTAVHSQETLPAPDWTDLLNLLQYSAILNRLLSSFERHHHCGSRCCHRGDDGAVWRVLRGSEECRHSDEIHVRGLRKERKQS